MNWSARGNVLNQYLRNTSIGTTVTDTVQIHVQLLHYAETATALYIQLHGVC
jgi:hypothetical protein